MRRARSSLGACPTFPPRSSCASAACAAPRRPGRWARAARGRSSTGTTWSWPKSCTRECVEMAAPMTDSSASMRDAVLAVVREARAAAPRLALASAEEKNAALRAMVGRLRADRNAILSANARDVEAARAAQLSEALIDRLTLTDQRLDGMVRSVEAVIELPDPVGAVIREWTPPNRLLIPQVRAPL